MEKMIATIPKNALEEIRIGLGEFKGHDLVGIRVWTDPYEGRERVPTKKGLSYAVEKLPEVIAGLQEAEAAAREAGLLGDDEREAA